MFERLVANASPLILLSGVGGLEWIAGLSGKPVLIPRAVATEVEAGAGGREIIDTIERDPRFEVVPDVSVPPYVVAWDVGAGESQVIAYCHQQVGAIAVLNAQVSNYEKRLDAGRGAGLVGGEIHGTVRHIVGWESARRKNSRHFSGATAKELRSLPS